MSKIVTDFSKFNPRSYLREYYTRIGTENQEILNFLHRAYANIFSKIKKARVLELGSGPTIYQYISLSKYSVSINITDYSVRNLDEVKKWQNNLPGAFSWKKFIKYVLDLENKTLYKAKHREGLIRSKIKKIYPLDITSPPKKVKTFDIVSSHFMAESMTDAHDKWLKILKNVSKFVKPDGFLVSSIILSSSSYHVGRMRFPSVPVQESDVISQLTKLRFSTLDTHFVSAEGDQGYLGIFMILAQKLDN